MATPSPISLPSLLSSQSYVFVYTLPLLILGLVLNFAGTFLTLDRTRSRAKPIPSASYQVGKKGKGSGIASRIFALEGGVGGLIVGLLFGVHLATFLALLIPSKDAKTHPLSGRVFLAICILSALITTFLSGRFKYAALAFGGVGGGSLLGLGLGIIIHPPIFVRQLFPPVFSVILLALLLIPLPRHVQIQHWTMRVCTSSLASYTIVLSIALLAHPRVDGWSNPMERWWVEVNPDSPTISAITALWGSRREKALSAGYALFIVAGIVADWGIWNAVGESIDEKWDEYLERYLETLPGDPSRAGRWHPPTSVWDKLTGKNKGVDDEFGLPPYPGTGDDKKVDPFDPLSDTEESFLGKDKKMRKKRKRSVLGGGKREKVKFQPLADLEMLTSSSDEEDPDGFEHIKKPWARQELSINSHSSTPTLVGTGDNYFAASPKIPIMPVKSKGFSNLSSATPTTPATVDVNYDDDIRKIKSRLSSGGKDGLAVKGLGEGEMPDYSDYESDSSKAKSKDGKGKKSQNKKAEKEEWVPGFMKSPSGTPTKPSSSAVPKSPPTKPSSSKEASSPTAAPKGAVPVTPSLIKALDRIKVAQHDVYDGAESSSSPASPKAKSSSKPINKTKSPPLLSESSKNFDPKDFGGRATRGDAELSEGGDGLGELWKDVKKVVGSGADTRR